MNDSIFPAWWAAGIGRFSETPAELLSATTYGAPLIMTAPRLERRISLTFAVTLYSRKLFTPRSLGE